MYTHDRACAYTGITLLSLTFILVVRESTLYTNIVTVNSTMAKGQIKNKGQKLAVGVLVRIR